MSQTQGCADGDPGQRRPDRELGDSASLTEPDREGVAADCGNGRDQQPGELERRVSRRQPVGGRLEGQAERRCGEEEQQHKPAERPQPAPTAGVQDPALSQLHQGAPAVGSGGRVVPVGSARRVADNG